MMRLLGRQLKFDVQDSIEVRRVAVLLRGLELNFLRGANRRLVEPVPETAHHFHDANLPGCRKDNLQQNLALNFKLSSFLSVNRTGLKCDLNR